MSAARNLAAGHGYTDLTGTANTTFGPGFPALLAIGDRLGLAVPTTARVVNAAAFGMVVLLTWICLRRHVRSRTIALVTTMLVAVSPTMLNVADHVWSEPVFCVLLLSFILVFESALRAPTNEWCLFALAGLITGVGFLVRYAALSLIVTAIVVILLTARQSGRRRLTVRLGAFSGAALPLPLAWILRNANTGAQYVLGPRLPRSGSVFTAVQPFASSAINLFVPSGVGLAVPVAAFIPVVTMVGLAARIRFRRRTEPEKSAALPDSLSMAPLAVFVIIYAIFVMAAGKFSGASVDSRTVMPIYVPLVIVGAWLVDSGLQLDPTRSVHLASALRRVSVVAIVALSMLLTISFVQMASDKGATPTVYASRSYTRSRLVNAVRRLQPGSVLTTNHPWRLYYATGRQPILPSPGPLRPAASLVPATVDQLGDQSCSQPTYYVWYRSPTESLTEPLKPNPEAQLVTLASYPDGVLYAVHPPNGECAQHLSTDHTK
jgi:hypothetical protein